MKLLLTFFLLGLGLMVAIDAAPCKCYPGDACWPSVQDWNSFNNTINGSLILGQPPASVCYPGIAYSQKACSIVQSSWFLSQFHAADPVSIDYPFWANNSCNPIFENGTSITGDVNAGNKSCTIGEYPVYAVNATSVETIIAAIKWATQRNIRLVVKNTGHSLLGRSTGYGSLSIWTHNIKSFDWQDNWTPSNCSGVSPQGMAATLGAGMQDAEVYALSAQHNAIIVGGSNPTVGMMGWFPGGGHGPLSSSYGMGADNLLEAVIVTPTGEVITANQCQNTDMYWALRGGGAGTFGVVIEATVKAFPSPQTTIAELIITQLDLNATNATSRWWNLMAQVHVQFPKIKDGGGQGYYTIVGPPDVGFLVYSGFNYHYNATNDTVNALYKPIIDILDGQMEFVNYTYALYTEPSFFPIWNATIGTAVETVATGGNWVASRLLTRRSFNRGVDAMTSFFEKIGPRSINDQIQIGNPAVLGHMIANDKNRNLDIALNPAWRDTVVHMIVISSIPDSSTMAVKQNIIGNSKNVYLAALKAFAPESGAYFNEADPTDPDFQNVFFGQNYARLHQIKQRYDPQSVFWCKTCVGSEAWVEGGDGRLCRS